MIIAVLIFSMLLFASYAALIIYYRQSWLGLPAVHSLNIAAPKKNTTKISVIIPARNEEQNIKDCLNSVCNQSYPQSLFEVLVIDDYSEDNTANIITSFADKNVQLISLKEITGGQKFNSYKKKAIEIAVTKSSGSLIVTTDADCIVPHHWLQTIADFYEATNAAFIAMPVSFFPPLKKDNPFTKCLKIFQSLDFMTLQGITGASVFKKAHSMCNGANLAYTKKAFEEVGGFKGIDAIASGDDMLLMHKIYKRYPGGVAFLKSANVIVQTKPMETLKAFIHQRIRWASKADKYDDKRIFAVLLLVYFFNAWCLVLFFLPPSLYPIPFFPLIIVMLKCAVELFFLYPVAKFFGQQKILWWFPFAQPFHIIYTIIAGWLGKFGSYQWKERKVN